jgi:hypothetical protein
MLRPSRDQLGGEGNEPSKTHGAAGASSLRPRPSRLTTESIVLIWGEPAGSFGLP